MVRDKIPLTVVIGGVNERDEEEEEKDEEDKKDKEDKEDKENEDEEDEEGAGRMRNPLSVFFTTSLFIFLLVFTATTRALPNNIKIGEMNWQSFFPTKYSYKVQMDT